MCASSTAMQRAAIGTGDVIIVAGASDAITTA